VGGIKDCQAPLDWLPQGPILRPKCDTISYLPRGTIFETGFYNVVGRFHVSTKILAEKLKKNLQKQKIKLNL
jgi:hypothetical protein